MHYFLTAILYSFSLNIFVVRTSRVRLKKGLLKTILMTSFKFLHRCIAYLLLFASSYTNLISLINHLSMPNFFITHQIIACWTLSKVFTRSSKARYSCLFFCQILFLQLSQRIWHWLIPHPYTKPDTIPNWNYFPLVFLLMLFWSLLQLPCLCSRWQLF